MKYITVFLIGLSIGIIVTRLYHPDFRYKDIYHISNVEKIKKNGIVISDSLELKEWSCKQVVTCEPADWIGIDGHGKARPEDHCIYENRIIRATKNPANYPEYGASCELKKQN